MELLSFQIEGTQPLLVHSDRLSNPLNPLTKEMKSFTSKRKKTDEDHEAIMKIEWEASIYMDDDAGPYIPGVMLEAAIRDAGKLQRLGTVIKRAMMVQEDIVPLVYTGPRTLEKMWRDGSYADVRSVKVQQARVQRCRGTFKHWQAEFTVVFNPEMLDPKTVADLVATAGQLIGIGDYRPRFGRFDVKEAA